MEHRALPLLIVAVLIIVSIVFVFGIHPYMAITRRVPANLLVVEGWLSESELSAAADEFRKGGYDLVVTTGGPIDMNTPPKPVSYADRSRTELINSGVADSSIQAIAAPFAPNDQSAETARAFRSWLEEYDLTATGINIFTAGIHGRRSRTLYQRVLGDRARVGVISTPETRYKPSLWFLSRTAIRKVVRNAGGYLYYRLLLQVNP